MSATRLACMATLVLGLCACPDDDNKTNAPEPRFAFSVTYSNSGWGLVQKGYFIDREGLLHTYDSTRAGTESFDESKTYTEQELSSRFELGKAYVERIPDADMDRFRSAANKARSADLTVPASICRDAGRFDYYAWYRQPDGRYKPVLIYRTGDWRQENQAPEAAGVKSFLIEKAIKYRIAFRLDPNGNNWCSGL